MVVVYSCECKENNKDMSYLKSDHEEADTKIVLHVLDAITNGATEIRTHSPGTDIDDSILFLSRYPDLCQNTVFVTGKGQNHRDDEGAANRPFARQRQQHYWPSMP